MSQSLVSKTEPQTEKFFFITELTTLRTYFNILHSKLIHFKKSPWICKHMCTCVSNAEDKQQQKVIPSMLCL